MHWTRLAIIALLLGSWSYLAPAAHALNLPPAAHALNLPPMEKSYQQAKDDYAKLPNDPFKWQALAQRFQALYASNPQSPQAPNCLFWSARVRAEAYRRFKNPQDMELAVQTYEQLINRFPRSNLADDAQFNKAALYEYSGDMERAYLEYLKLGTDFPQGDMRPQADKQLDRLEGLLSPAQNRPPAAITTPPPSGPPPTSPEMSQVQGLRQWSSPGYARVVLDLERPAPYSSRLLRTGLDDSGPKSVQLDLRRTRMGDGIKNIVPAADGLLQSVQYSGSGPDQVTVLINLKNLMSYKIFTLDNPFRLVVDCFSQAPETTARGDKPAGAHAPPAVKTTSSARPASSARVPRGRAAATPTPVGLAAQLGLHVRTVVLDPGHGGKDPGAVSGKFYEKNITLDLAQRVAVRLRKYLDCQVLLTRSADVFVPLEERTAFANTKGADLFVSIHVNSAANSKLNGVETYFLNLATDEAAMRVAARENAASQRSLNDLQVILNDLMTNSKINESNRLARIMQQQVMGSVRAKYKVVDLKVKQAPFYVLMGAQMPAVLCEVGFISNPSERKRLGEAAYLNLLAEGIARGVVEYNKQLLQAGK